MPFNFNLENIVLQKKTRDMSPSISTTMLRVKYCKHSNPKASKAPPFDGIYIIYIYIYIYISGPLYKSSEVGMVRPPDQLP